MVTANKAIALALTLAATALAQQAGAPVEKSTQGPRSGVTVRKRPAPDASENMAATAVFRAESALEKKDYAAAETALKEAVRLDPKSYRAWFDLGVLYTATNRPSDAVDAYRTCVELDPKLFEANFNLGVLLARREDPEAEKYLRAATQLTPTMGKVMEARETAWQTLGQVLKTSKPKEALQAFQQAAQINPKDVSPHLLAGAMAEKLNDLATAEKEYAAAQQIDPNNAEAAAGTANVLMAAGKLEEAETAVRKYMAVVAKEPSNRNLAAAHTQLGRVLLQLHRRDEAISEFEEALKLAPGDANAAQQLAWMYLQDKQYAKAEMQFRDLLAKDPKDAELHHGLGSALLQQKKFPEAQQELIQAVQLKPNLGDAYADLAFAASENKRYDLTVKALDARAKLGLPEIPGTLFLRATALDHLGDKVNASASYRDFLAASNGKYPDQEWQARHRLIAIDPKKK